eukprot:TRINITY_DN1063_c0_g1_i2.p3 TRINITY_DN1063_c0_g1~~TRINITY_DN1063_c0_g1_i2.p3  ORF type:complete len:103 (-),score=17.28 TRINITY_DN1063_c0_g1_i2:84-392(-)
MIGVGSCQDLAPSSTDAAVYYSKSVALWQASGDWFADGKFVKDCGSFGTGTHVLTMVLDSSARTVTMTTDTGATTGSKPVPAGDLYIMFVPYNNGDRALLLL